MHRLASSLLTLFMALHLSGCDGAPTGVDPVGAWGGEGVALSVTPTGADLEFDCATGTMDEPLPSKSGVFTVQGTFTREFGGAGQPGLEPDVQEAIWTGTLAGRRMTLSGTFGDGDTPVGPYELQKGMAPLLRKCE